MITSTATNSPQTVALAGVGEDFTIAAAPSSATAVTVVAGQTATFTLALSPQFGFTQAIHLACDGAPQHSSCVVTPNSVTLGPNASSTVTVSVTTMASSLLSPRMLQRRPTPDRLKSWPALLWLVAFCAFTVFEFARLVRGNQIVTPRTVLMGVVILLIYPLLVSCGGSGGSGKIVAGTPAGTYNLNVSSTSSPGTITLAHQVQLTLTVN